VCAGVASMCSALSSRAPCARPGIVYCLSRKDCENMAQKLNEVGAVA
jgi:superfamily II DNA helicase RecQ